MASKPQVKENIEKHNLEAFIKDQLDLLDQNKSNLDGMIKIKSKEMKELIVRISIKEIERNISKKK